MSALWAVLVGRVQATLGGGTDGFGTTCVCLEVGAGGVIGFGTALFPVAQDAEGDLVAGGEFFLGEAEGRA